MYGYWSHCLYSCDVESFESYVKSNKQLPTAKFDKYYNVVEPLIPLNTYASNINLRQTISVDESNNNNNNSNTVGNRHSTQLTGLNLRENESSNNDGDDVVVVVSGSSDNETSGGGASSVPPGLLTSGLYPNRLSVPVSLDKSKPTMTSMSSLSSLIKDLDELWTVNPQPPYAAEVILNRF